MAVCGSLRSLLDSSPMSPESQTLVESLSSWNQINPVKPIEAASVTEILRELYFQEKRVVEPPSVDINGQVHDNQLKLDSFHGGYSSKNHEPLHMCTEGLGSESSDVDVDDLMIMENNEDGLEKPPHSSLMANTRRIEWNAKPGKSACSRVFPPPISSIGKGGRPRVCLRPYREDGRFVLRETRIPCRELLHASRQDGRLKLHFVRPVVTKEEEEKKKKKKMMMMMMKKVEWELKLARKMLSKSRTIYSCIFWLDSWQWTEHSEQKFVFSTERVERSSCYY